MGESHFCKQRNEMEEDKGAHCGWWAVSGKRAGLSWLMPLVNRYTTI